VRFARLKGQTVSEQTLFWEAAEIVWKAKREYRSELKTKRVERAAMVAAQFRLAKTADG
jgi:predicted metal-dependent hydrolase